MNNLLKTWMQKANSAQWGKLAKIASTSITYLYQIASGKRKATPDMAARIEKAAEIMHHEERTGLLPRHLISKICSECHYVSKRKK